MQASDRAPDGSGAEQAVQPRGSAGNGRPGRKAGDWPGGQRARRVMEWGKVKYAGSWAEYLWQRLDAADFMNQAMLLAATLLLCAVPFFLIATALTGRSAVQTLTVRLGLSQPIGVVFALMSFFIAIGVVIILGAAVGMMWQDRGLSFRAAVRKLRRKS